MWQTSTEPTNRQIDLFAIGKDKSNRLALGQIFGVQSKNTFLVRLYDSSERIVNTRVNQSFFRKTIHASYNNSCCITGLNNSKLLIAGHIKPWGLDKQNHLNPRNGILLNGLHDKAFEVEP